VSDYFLRHIRTTLEREFKRHIDLSDAESYSDRDRENLFLSRSLAAYALCLEADITAELAASHVTDGFNDHGIDAIYFDPVAHHAYAAQSKWMHKQGSSMKASDVRTFTDGFRMLLDGDLTQFNDHFRRLEREINSAIGEAGNRFTLILAYSGTHALSRDVDAHMKRVLAELNDPYSDVFTLAVYSQRELHDAVAGRVEGSPIHLPEVTLHDWTCVKDPYVAYQGQVAATEIADWYTQHKEKLFRKNLRQVIPGSDVNVAMADTLRKEPRHFWYFNNGITIICDSIKPRAKGGATRAPKSLSCTGVSIVNGAQTVGAIALAHASEPGTLDDAWVSVRLVSLEDCPEGFAEAITRATNTQNSIVNRDFAALDEHQRRIRRELALEGKEYAFRTGEVEVPPPPDRGLTIDEATVALACEHDDVQLAVIAKSAIGRFWEHTNRTPYTSLFHARVSGTHVWRVVETLRAIEAALGREQSARTGRQKQAAIHGNRFVAHQVFKRLRTLHGSIDQVSGADLEREVPALTTEALDATVAGLDALFHGSYLQMFFKAPDRCRRLDQHIASPMASALPPLGTNLPLWKQ
jgi:hypothetical protein